MVRAWGVKQIVRKASARIIPIAGLILRTQFTPAKFILIPLLTWWLG